MRTTSLMQPGLAVRAMGMDTATWARRVELGAGSVGDHSAIVWATVVFGLCGVSLSFVRPDPWVLVSLTGLAGIVLSLLPWELLVGLMIAVGFFAGSLRMVYGNWTAYLPPEILVALVLVRWVARNLSRDHALRRRTAVTVPFAVLSLYCVIQFLHPAVPLVRSLLGFRSWLMYTALLFAGHDGYHDRRQVELLTRIVVVLGLIAAAFGIWQWLVGPDRLAELGGWYSVQARNAVWGLPEGRGTVVRVPASFSSSTALSANMAFVIVLSLGSFLAPTSSVRWRFVCVAAIAVMGCGMAVSGSRMGPGLLLVSLTTLLIFSRRLNALITMAVASAIGLWLVYQVSGTILLPRFATLFEPGTFFWKWVGPLRMGIVEMGRFPFGRGLGYAVGLPNFISGDDLIDMLQTGAVADSGYGAAALEMGFAGIVLLSYFAGRLSRGALAAWRRLPDQTSKDLFLGPAVWAVSFPVALLFMTPHASPPVSMYHWIFVGMLLRAGATELPARRPFRGPLSSVSRHVAVAKPGALRSPARRTTTRSG